MKLIIRLTLLVSFICCVAGLDFDPSTEEGNKIAKRSSWMRHRGNVTPCRSVCQDVNLECSNNCYTRNGTANTPFSGSFKTGKEWSDASKDDRHIYDCFSVCLGPSNHSIVVSTANFLSAPTIVSYPGF